jgi:FdhD protein
MTMRHPPQSAKPTHVLEWDEGRRRRVLDEVATEEPLEIRVGDEPLSVTMRTPGDDFELAAGFLLTEGLIARRDEIARIAYANGPDGRPSGNLVAVTLAAGKTVDLGRIGRRFVTASSCGVCGKASIDAVRARQIQAPSHSFSLDPRLLTRLPAALRTAQRVFGRTGGLHAAALFDPRGALVTIREDIGRHNAVDKVIGHELLNGRLPLSGGILMVSGRGGFEIVQKALVAGLPVLASVSAPSTLAVQLSRDYGLTLIGFLRGSRFIVYSGEHRLQMDGATAAAPGAPETAPTASAKAKSRRGAAASPE